MTANRLSANVGDQVKISGTVTTVAAGAATDPTVVKAWTRSPGGTVTTYTYGVDGAVVKTATGAYAVTFDVDVAGIWYAGFYSTGTGKGASPDFVITVDSSRRS